VKQKAFAAGVLALVAVCVGAQSNIGAEAIFPYPIYSKQFIEHSRLYPGVIVIGIAVSSLMVTLDCIFASHSVLKGGS
jgi:hypothetical protein